MDLRIGILTVSDRVSRGEMEDRGGPAVRETLQGFGWVIAEEAVVPDDVDAISGILRAWVEDSRLDVILTTGGTGLGPRDVTPEATLQVAPRKVPGIAEAIRAASLAKTQGAMLSRGVAATSGTTLVVNLPGSPGGARDGVEVVRPILEHAVVTLRGGSH